MAPTTLRGRTSKGGFRELHISREARERYGVEGAMVALHGDLLIADEAAAQALALTMNRVRDVARYPALGVKAGDLLAAGIWHEVCHLVVRAYHEGVPDLSARALDHVTKRLGKKSVEQTLLGFVEAFPAAGVQLGEVTAKAYLGGSSNGASHREVVLEELLLLWLENENPALERMKELFDDAPLRANTSYPQVLGELKELFADTAESGAKASLFDLLLAPIRNSPTSLQGQLEYMRRHWGDMLGNRFDALLQSILRAIDVMGEERHGAFPGGEVETFVLDADTLGVAEGPVEYERFSPDASWMPRVVMMAKSTYVWLDQLSRQYGREISRLDQVPDEELDVLAARGFTTLWLIGLWERSDASRKIKHLRGQPDAVASAYALHDYQIAKDLGGEEAYRNLRDRASMRSIRLASDMVPNHVGIDGKWVTQHPDWFVQLDHPPYPGYSFTGPDLAGDGSIGIFLEDHYYDNSDAAVVFKRVDRASGEERYIYHGNDGTSMPWNDTAQLDYLKPEVREAVIQTILEVARRFPVIRFDAAMTLAKRHIQRLWYPPPGEGGAIPSRSAFGSMKPAEFEAALPEEFWREVVDRVAREVPDTLLLAEAFWMMEGYFVRTLGMHRVYNSAFMNMLKREENEKYRASIKNILEFEPEILKRFVNFMNNPDEETAVHQFGKDDKYFGVCVLMATMPGLPMFGHGQIEGFEEKYGMEYRRAKRAEVPDAHLVARHEREIFPLLHRRAQFAEAENFVLFDVVAPEGHVNENVFAYANRFAEDASLVLFNNSYESAKGRIHRASPSKTAAGLGILDALGMAPGAERFAVLRNHVSGLEHLYRTTDLDRHGLPVDLRGFMYQVFVDVRQLEDDLYGSLSQLHDELGGRGVASVADATEAIRLRPVHQAVLRAAVQSSAQIAAKDLAEALTAAEDRLGGELKEGPEAVATAYRARLAPAPGELPKSIGASARRRLEQVIGGLGADERALVNCAVIYDLLGDSAAARIKLDQALQDRYGAERALLPRLLVANAQVAGGASADSDAQALLGALKDSANARRYLKVNEHEGVQWFDKEAFDAFVGGLVSFKVAELLAGEPPSKEAKSRLGALADLADALLAAAKASSYRLESLAHMPRQRQTAARAAKATGASAQRRRKSLKK